MKRFMKKIVLGTVAITIIGANSMSYAWNYQVKYGDTYWKLSNKYGVSLNSMMTANNANQNTTIFPGQYIIIPESNNYFYYTVQFGDTSWNVSDKFGVIMKDFLNINNMDENDYLYPKQKVKIPINNVPIVEKAGEKYGEYLDWWSGARYVVPRGAVFKIVDFYTGEYFMAKRTVGSNHADVETLTLEDTKKMKKIWGGSFNWEKRPAIIEYNGRRIAASVAGMPHAGDDRVKGGAYTSWRSGNYGYGINLDYVKNNGMHGVFDVHFLNSTRHKDGTVDKTHQKNIKISAGVKK